MREKPFEKKELEAAYLKGQQLGVLQATKGKLISEKEISVDGAQGREFIIQVSDKDMARTRIVMAGRRVVHLQVWGMDQNALQSKDTEKFLQSLKFTK
jgi:hypothetical protein